MIRYMEPDKLQILVRKVIDELTSNVFDYESYNSWESIRFPEGYEKPSKGAFEAKLQELIDVQPLKELRDKRNQVLEQTDRYATIDYPHATDEEKQKRMVQRQTLRDLPTLVTPLEDGSMKVWVTDEGGPLQPRDGLVASNVAGYFTKGEPAVVTICDCCDFSTSTTETYKIRYLDASGQQTDEANAVHIAAFVGCTYHCG